MLHTCHVGDESCALARVDDLIHILCDIGFFNYKNKVIISTYEKFITMKKSAPYLSAKLYTVSPVPSYDEKDEINHHTNQKRVVDKILASC